MEKRTYSVPSKGVELQAYTWGDSSRTPIVLLHGYPDNHLVWQSVAERLSQNFYVVSYDMRGAGASSKPKGRKHYQFHLLEADFTAVAKVLLAGRSFHLAGHDWGSIQGWEFITSGEMQSRILSYTSISGPCLDHAAYWFRARFNKKGASALLGQTLNSWYIALFQLPWLPEAMWHAGLGARWPWFLKQAEGVQEVEVNPYQTSDGAMGVWLYRANMLPTLCKPQERYAHCPVQLLVPTQDRYVSAALFDDLPRWVPELYRTDVEAGHWLTLSSPELVANKLSRFVQAVEVGETEAIMRDERVR
ncbi:MAG TPA: alpha/beta fold hydrolase [Alcanivoracaceae bacterium]|nr:alpha/beta fold hydrolase [Alcanivoracaceae bacterium]